MIRTLATLACLAGSAAGAFAQGLNPLDEAVAEALNEAEEGTGAVLRGLDKVNAEVTDLEIASGAAARFGRLSVSLRECRYPTGNPAGDAYAFVTISDTSSGAQLFAGWMIASSPALDALEHPRYDIWVLRCTTE